MISTAAMIAMAVAVGPSAGAQLFEEAPSALPSPQPCAASNEGCYSHYVLMVDLDNDGDQDLVFANGGGYYQPGETAPLAAYLNDGQGGFTEAGGALFGGFSGRVRQIAAGDVDGDGDVDLYLPDAFGLQPDALFISNGASPPVFRDLGQARIGRSSRAGATRFGDVDGDGDLDLVVTDWGDDPPSSAGTAAILLNDGMGAFTELSGGVPTTTDDVGTGPIDIDLFDADQDFDLDLLLASRSGDSLLFINRGDGRFDFADGALPGQPGPYVYGPAVCDIDGDGDLDLWLDNGSANRRAQLLVNSGDGQFIDETELRIPKPQNSRADDNRVQCVDVDHDGDFDVVIASLSGNERVLINDSAGYFNLRPWSFPKISDASLGIDLGDLDGDHKLDAVTAQGENGSYLNRVYLGTARQVADTYAPTFRGLHLNSSAAPGGVSSITIAVSDGAITDIGAGIARVFLVFDDGDQLDATFMGGDLYQLRSARIGSGTSVAALCAIDRAGNERCQDVSPTLAYP